MRRTIFVFLLGAVTGVVVAVFLRGPLDVGSLSRDAGAALEEAGRGARHLQLQARVRTALALQKEFDLFGDISVSVEDAAVTLRGTVTSEAQHSLAAIIAKGVDGVDSVVNELTIRRSTTRAPEPGSSLISRTWDTSTLDTRKRVGPPGPTRSLV